MCNQAIVFGHRASRFTIYYVVGSSYRNLLYDSGSVLRELNLLRELFKKMIHLRLEIKKNNSSKS